jgi:hypothetical protein
MKSLSTLFLALFATSTLFSQPLQINPGAGDNHPIATVLGDTLTGAQSKQLVPLIIVPLFDRFAKDNKLEPTRGELDTFVQKMNEKRHQNIVELDQQKIKLTGALKSDTLTPEARGQAEKSLANLEKFRAGLVEMDKKRSEGSAETLKDELESAKQFVGSWKVNHALHKKYGGRVIFQQMGPEPLDAYRDFLKEQEKKGAFKLLDTGYTTSFWNYFVNEGMHSFYDKEEGDRLMTIPWWVMETPVKN